MSETAAKQSWVKAWSDSEDLLEVLDRHAERWEVAGSVRRKMPQVGDVDHVVIPKFDAVPVTGSGGLFGDEEEVKYESMLWRELDRLVDRRETNDELVLLEEEYAWDFHKSIKSDGRPRWGDRYRSIQFQGHTHEIYTTTPDSWGITLLIRTGPSDFSRFVVTELKKRGYRAKDGQVERRVGGDYAGVSGEDRWEPVSVPTEQDVFKLIGMTYREPNQRNGRW